MTAICTLLFAFTALPANADPYTNSTCAQEGSISNLDGDNAYCQVITGPGSLSHKSLASAGAGACQSEAPGGPVECDVPTAPGGGGAGAAAFDPSLSLTTEVYARIDTWVEYTGTSCVSTVTTICGFDVLLCNDRDLDSTCTNIGDSSDQLYSTQSNEPTVGEDCTNTDKDTKDCEEGDDLDAQVGACMRESEVGTWDAGQIVVFIGAYVDTWPGGAFGGATNAGAGITAGSYEVWLRTTPGTCTPPQCDDKIDNADAEDILVDFPADPGCDSPSDNDETDTPDSGVQPGLCLITRTLLVNPVNGMLLLDVHVFPCAPANCSVPPASPPGTVNNVRTVTCSATDACDGLPVTVVAVVVGGTSAEVTDACDGAINAQATATWPYYPIATDYDYKAASGDWTCVLETNAAGVVGVFFGAGICLKPDNL